MPHHHDAIAEHDGVHTPGPSSNTGAQRDLSRKRKSTSGSRSHTHPKQKRYRSDTKYQTDSEEGQYVSEVYSHSSDEMSGSVSDNDERGQDESSDEADLGATLRSLEVNKNKKAKPKLADYGNAVGSVSLSVTEPNAPQSTVSKLHSLKQFFESEEKCGGTIHDDLAQILNDGLVAKLSETKINEVGNKYLRPQNCNNFVVPKVNEEIWDKLSRATMQKDVSMQKIQGFLMKGIISLTSLLDKVMATLNTDIPLDPAEVWTMATDTFQMLAFTSAALSQKRKELIKPDLDKSYKRLCGGKRPVSTWLFGDELTKQIKDINESQKVGRKVTGHSPGHYGHSRFHRKGTGRGSYHSHYKPYQQGHGGTGPFLKGRKPYFNKKKGEHKKQT